MMIPDLLLIQATPETVYDGKWYDMEEGFKKAEINFFCIAKMDKKHGLPHAKEVFALLEK